MVRTSKIGVNGRNDSRFEEADFQVIREAKLESIKMMSLTSVEVFQRLKAENPNLEIITRLHHPGFNTGGHPSPEEFVNAMAPIIGQLQPYCTQFQIHNEPNHAHRYEGWGNTDDDARSFNDWFLDVYARLKQIHPWASFGFPGLALPDPLHRDKAWLQICRPAIERADWLGCHCYWQTPPNGGSVMMADHSGLSFKYYHDMYPNKLIHILECGNSNGQGQGFSTDEGLYADEYQQWLNEVFKYPYIGSTAFFILSSPDPVWDSFAWRTNGSIKNRIVGGIGNMGRPELGVAQVGQSNTNGAQPGTNGAQPQQPNVVPTPNVQVGNIPPIFTHQNLIDAFYNVAGQLGVGNWDVLTKAGLDVAQLAQNRQAIYQGAALAVLPNLSPIERTLVAVELVGQMRKAKKTTGVVNAPDGLNLRSGAGSDQTPLMLLQHQTQLDVMHEAGEWLFAATNDGHAGYVHGSYVARADAAPQPVPTPVAPPMAGGSRAMAGYLASTPELVSIPLAPSAAEQIALGASAGPGAKLLAGIWNRYGGLLNALAAKLSIDPALAVAILAVESGGNAFGADGRMIIRFENHLFYHYWGKQNPDRFAQCFTFNSDRCWEGHSWRSDPNQPFQEFHGNQSAEWAALNFAASLDDTAAKFSISMGLPQIMGFNHQRIGYANVQEMFNAFQADERNHVLGLFDFINADANMVQALRSQNYAGFAAGYNGPGQADYYGGLILKWVQSFGLLRQDPSSASFAYQDTDAPVLGSDLDAAISFLPMPQPAAVFMQVTAPSTTFSQTTPTQAAVETTPATPAATAVTTTVATATQAEAPQAAQPAPAMDGRLYDLWLEHIKHGFENNNIMFNRVLRAFMVPYYMTIAMYVVMFAVGIGLFVVAARLSSQQGTQLAGLFFGGLGIASFLGYFMSKPLRSLEENLQFITWLGVVYNTYWTRLLYMQNATSIQADLKEATAEAVTQIEHMLNKNVEVAYKRPEPKEEKG